MNLEAALKKLIKPIVLVLILYGGCKTVKNPVSISNTDNAPLLPARPVSGHVALPARAAITTNQIEILSAAGQASPSASGNFGVSVVEGEKQQIVLARNESTGNTVLLGYLSPDSATLQFSSSSTALSLIMLHPMLLCTSKTERDRMAQSARTQLRFRELVRRIDELLQSRPDEVLDAERHPEIFQLSVEIGNTTLQGFRTATNDLKGNTIEQSLAENPTIANGSGENILFINPRTIFYCAGIWNGEYQEREPDNMVLLSAKESLVSVILGWPPVVMTEPTMTEYAIGQGQFYLRLESGTRSELSKLAAFTPEGYAFRANMLKGIGFVIDLLIGWDVVGNKKLFSFGGLARFTVNIQNVYKVIKFFIEGKALDGFSALVNYVKENSQSIGLWLWEAGYDKVTSDFMDQAAKIAGNMSIAFKIISAGNEKIPFVYDWVTSPPVLDYCVIKQPGRFSECGINAPPQARFTVSPLAGDIQTVFAFDATGTTDDADYSSDIKVRWDFNGDGVWDTGWTLNKKATHAYSSRESYTILMQAQDRKGLTGTAHTVINVSGGYASGKHIVIFRDVLPWQNVRIEELLKSNGFTAGTGQNQFEIVPSAYMSEWPLTPGFTFLVISNSQTQTFYNNYAANNLRFAGFVFNGGTIFWEACDLGWYNNDKNSTGGDLRKAGVMIPGNIWTKADYDSFNYVTDPSLLLVKNIPTIIRHNYASHESFYNVPVGTTVYMKNESGEPTLIEYKYGGGWVVATGQPIEHGYYLGKELGTLLPRIVAYILGSSTSSSVKIARHNDGEPGISSAVPGKGVIWSY